MNRARIIRMLSEANEPPGPATIQSEKTSPTSDSSSLGNGASKLCVPSKTTLETIPESNGTTPHIDHPHEHPEELTNGLNGHGRQKAQTKGQNEPNDLDELEMLEAWDPLAEDYYSTTNTLVLNPDKEPECVVTGKMSEECTMLGKHRVCEFFLKHGTCADGKYCSRLHIDPAARSRLHLLQKEHEMNTGKTRMISSYLSPVELVPNNGNLLLVSVTMTTSPTMFYFVAPYEQMNFDALQEDEVHFYVGRVQSTSIMKTKLQKCHEQLATLFDHNYRVDNSKIPLGIGQMVACKLPDGRFCRATVLSFLETEHERFFHRVFLIDIGIEVNIDRDEIYEIRASCLSEPPMAILGRLPLKPADEKGRWSSDATSFFEKFVARSKYLLCKVISHHRGEDLFTVDLLSMTDRTSITDLMLGYNYAKRTP